ncbi:MAG TPA: hypothetical protein VFD36_20485 [Kofleriaceae bacterium]|nr:hypothetical protein [Kofleriaceae bacterium]
MLIAIFPVVAIIVGLLLWALASNPKVAEAGRLTFFAGMLALLFALATHTIRIG